MVLFAEYSNFTGFDGFVCVVNTYVGTFVGAKKFAVYD
jgi:hypothetical protein